MAINKNAICPLTYCQCCGSREGKNKILIWFEVRRVSASRDKARKRSSTAECNRLSMWSFHVNVFYSEVVQLWFFSAGNVEEHWHLCVFVLFTRLCSLFSCLAGVNTCPLCVMWKWVRAGLAPDLFSLVG